MPWRQLSFSLPSDLADEVSDLLDQQAALAVTFSEQDDDEPVLEPPPGETPLWQTTRLTALFEMDTDLNAIQSVLEQAFGHDLTHWCREVVEDQPWERAWLEHFQPTPFGRLWVCPSGQAPADPSAIRLTLDPGLAFGTGGHPTTALCLDWLADQALQGKTVLDYGCGSGILAIASLLLGAQQAVAVDIDPQALTATQKNAENNRVAKRLICCYPHAMPDLSVDVVVANILAKPLIELAPHIIKFIKRGGTLALSGILEEQMSAVEKAYRRWVEFDLPIVREGWALITGNKKN